MMTYVHPDYRKQMAERRRLEAEREAADWRLVRAAVRKRCWWKRKGCWLISQVGRVLIWSGHRLQEVGALQSG